MRLRVIACLIMLSLSSPFLLLELISKERERPIAPGITDALPREQPLRKRGVVAAASEPLVDKVPVALGMHKDAVRALWGEPTEVQKIRTCLGADEEWVYRVDLRRDGASERRLLFDENGVLTEIK